MKNKLSVTIGIPAYNESANIENVLMSIIIQKENYCIVDKIIVFSDGSTDGTNDIVIKISKDDKRVELASTSKRNGKSFQLNRLYKMATSDICLQFDADIILSNDDVVDNMIKPFLTSSDLTVLSGNNIPLPGKTFVEKLTNGSDLLWSEVRLNFNSGENIYNSSGCITAIRRSFYQTYRIPEGTVADQQYLYLRCVTSGGRFSIAKNAVVNYRSPNNLKDFFKQAGRSLHEKNQIDPLFDEDISKYYFIPSSIKRWAIIKRMVTHPIMTSGAILLQIILRFLPTKKDVPENGLWTMITSTKKIEG